ncbi:unnamed protein product [Hermetia illucens]|uniref:Uncharacterized protein n=1 Tax=Hermetia illucens TaxID=343691 RepID=A0A7R8UDC0_HERIL|nr:unnamed protein product [Hermetia illucens]
MDFKTITAHISSLPNFMGDQHDLHTFIGSIDSIQKMIQTFSEDQQTLINYQIMGKLLGKPKEVVNALPSTQWTSIKGALLLHFDEPELESRLMEKILAAQFTTPAELYEYVTEQAANEIKLRREMVKYCYIDKCPEPVRGVLCAHKPDTLEAAYAILVNAGYLHFSVNQNRNSSQYNNYTNTFRNHVSNRNKAPNQFNRNRNFSQYDNTFRNQVNHNLNHNYPPTQFNPSRNSSQNNYSNNNFRNQVYEPNNNQTQFNHHQNSGNYNQRPHSRNFRRNDLSMPTDVSMNTATTSGSSLHMGFEKFSITSLGRLPILRLTIEGRPLKCLIDTGSTHCIMNSKLVGHNRRYPLDKPFIMSTIHKKEEIRYGLKTEFPSEFRTKHYIGWKLIDFVSNTFDCIIGQNALSGTQAILDFSKNIITINNISLSFIQEGENYSMIANEVSNILNKESSEIPEISVNPNNETNYTTEENLMIERIKDEFADIQYDKHKKLTFTHEIKHELKLTTSEPIYQQNYRYPYSLRDFVKRQIKEDLEQVSDSCLDQTFFKSGFYRTASIYISSKT